MKNRFNTKIKFFLNKLSNSILKAYRSAKIIYSNLRFLMWKVSILALFILGFILTDFFHSGNLFDFYRRVNYDNLSTYIDYEVLAAGVITETLTVKKDSNTKRIYVPYKKVVEFRDSLNNKYQKKVIINSNGQPSIER